MENPEMTLCHVLDGDKVLLKMANRGVSAGKWNAPGGKREADENIDDCVVREVLEETGLTVSDTFKHGVIRFYMDGNEDLTFLVHLFSTRHFSGELKSSDAGEVKWVDIWDIPLDDMWDDDKYWLDLMFRGRKFDADFYFDKDDKVRKYSVTLL